MKRTAILIMAGFALLFLSGFDLSMHSIPSEEILPGGPAKDGIPAIDDPEFLKAGKAGFLKNKDRVIGLVVKGEAKAYPIRILNWHEIVNDKIGGRPVAVSFCPLCGTGMVFDADSAGRGLTFGVSGLLYQSDMLLYDRQTESLWSQIKSEAVAGKLTGRKLKLISSTQTTWGAWKNKHPKTLVLSTRTGYSRDYDRDPYVGYEKTKALFFPVSGRNEAYHPKEQVIGVKIGNVAKAYPFVELAKARLPVNDSVNGKPLTVEFDKKTRTAVMRDKDGKEIPTVVGFWFAWFAFHPDTKIFSVK